MSVLIRWEYDEYGDCGRAARENGERGWPMNPLKQIFMSTVTVIKLVIYLQFKLLFNISVNSYEVNENSMFSR